MKGISHFITGVAIATFFPDVVRQAALGILLPVLGGIGGILPDTIDFKIARYWERFDFSIDPGPEPDAGRIADVLVRAMQKAYQEGQSQSVIAHTIRLGADLWREYTIRFIPGSNEIAVRIGAMVNTGQVPYVGSEPKASREVRRQVGVPLVNTYSEAYKINIFSGPTFRFAREGEQLYVHFLDWHHRWTHSLILAIGVGLVMGVLIGLLTGDQLIARWSGLVTWLGYSGHILEDQLGHMGSNLLWPFTKKRIPGPGLIHASDALPNFLTVWTSIALILYNLDRFSGGMPLLPESYLLTAVAVPWVILGGIYVLGKVRQAHLQPAAESIRQSERIAEATPFEPT